jgi:hypothetical protein
MAVNGRVTVVQLRKDIRNLRLVMLALHLAGHLPVISHDLPIVVPHP